MIAKMTNSEIHIAITKEQLAEMSTVNFPGHITVVDTAEEAKSAVSFLMTQKVVGFDTETKPSFRKGHVNTVSLIQVSTADHCYLFRLKKCGFGEDLRAFLETEDVVKVGLSLHDDFMMIHRVEEFTPGGFVDLQTMVKDYGITDISLQKIYGIIFGKRISKSQRLSNWEATSLTDRQQAYASIDAWACLRIYCHLTNGNFDPASSPYKVVDEPE